MAAPANILISLDLDRLLRDDVPRDPAPGRMVFASAAMIRGFHHVIESERPGAWRTTMKAVGHTTGRQLGKDLDARLAIRAQPPLSGLPLEACLALLEEFFVELGWGLLKIDLTDAAEHSLVVARLQNSVFVEALPEIEQFVDALPAGLLHGFFEYITGLTLGCEEIACVRRGAAECTFAITAPEHLARVMPMIDRESAEALIARLRA